MTPVELATWTDDDLALWARIAARDFEPSGDAFTFTARLARDHGWRLDTARRAVDEYRRFCVLALRRDGPVTPSQEVDEVWHQHLTFSRDDWQVWCGTVLSMALHHEPTCGGVAGDLRFADRYAHTLARYEAWFGPPPEDVWPGTADRFGRGPRFRVVDRDRHVVMPLPRRMVTAGRRLARGLSLGAVAVVLSSGPASAAPLDVLDWTAQPFLVLCFALAFVSLTAASGLRLLLARGDAASPMQEPLNPVESGLLAGGRQRAADVVTLDAILTGDAAIESSRIAVDGRLVTRLDLLRELSVAIDTVQSRLAERGLALSVRRRRLIGTATPGLILPILALGFAKLAVGVARHKDIGWLFIFMLATAIAGLVTAYRRSPASWTGRAVLSAFKRAIRASCGPRDPRRS